MNNDDVWMALIIPRREIGYASKGDDRPHFSAVVDE